MRDMFIKRQTPPMIEPGLINTHATPARELRCCLKPRGAERPPAVMWSVFLVFLSYLDGDFAKGQPLNFFLDPEKEGKVLFHMLDNTFCGKISVVGPYSLYEVSDGAENVRSVHDSAGNLVDCSVTADPIHVKSFTHVCRRGLREQSSESTVPELKFTNVIEAKKNCATLRSQNPNSAAAQTRSPHGAAGRTEGRRRRSRRGFTYPGTLWCGAGNIADSYEQLGEFAKTDECCRAHDYCPDVIHAFSFKYGYVNLKWHSVSHCDCDNALKQCLRKVNDTSSRVVGQAFFNVIEVPCFEFSFEEQCVERYWYGVCKRYGRVPVAVLRESIPYDFGGVELIDAFTMSPPKKKLAEVETTQASESTTPSSVSGSASTTQPLPKVVTAAEDFIKALAAVSTSQCPASDGSRDAHAADKKRKKNVGKKRKDSKKRRRKEQGKKRKQSTDAAPAAQDRVVGTPPARRANVLTAQNGFGEDPGNFHQISDNFMNAAFSRAGDPEYSNKMMRDQYQRMTDESQDSKTTPTPPPHHHHHQHHHYTTTNTTTTTPQAQPSAEMLELPKPIKDTESAQLSSASHIHSIAASKPRRAGLRQRVEKERKRYPAPLPVEATVHNRHGDATPVSVSENTSQAPPRTHSTFSTAGEEVSHSLEYQHEKASAFSSTTENRPIVGTERLRLRRRGERKRNRKLCTSPSPAEGEAPPSLTADEPRVVKFNATRELSEFPSPEQQSPSEGVLPSRLENPAVKGTTGTIKITIRAQRWNGTGGRSRCALSSCHTPVCKVVSTKRLEAMTTTVDRTKPSPVQADVDAQRLPQTQETEASTGFFFPVTQTSTPFVSPLMVGTTKRRRSNRGMMGKVEDSRRSLRCDCL